VKENRRKVVRVPVLLGSGPFTGPGWRECGCTPAPEQRELTSGHFIENREAGMLTLLLGVTQHQFSVRVIRKSSASFNVCVLPHSELPRTEITIALIAFVYSALTMFLHYPKYLIYMTSSSHHHSLAAGCHLQLHFGERDTNVQRFSD
jgi:hypothetical protein